MSVSTSILMGVSLAVILSLGSLPALAEDKQVQEEAIREVVFRYIISPANFASRSGHKVYFFALENDKDPSAAFLKRFAGHKPPIKKVSESHWDPKPLKGMDQSTAFALYGIRDKKSGQTGIIYRVTAIKWLSEDHVEVKGGYYSGGRSAASATYDVKRTGTQWKVVAIKNIMKS